MVVMAAVVIVVLGGVNAAQLPRLDSEITGEAQLHRASAAG